MTTTNKGLEQPAYNSNVNTWGTGPLNDNFGYIDLALGGSTLLNATGLGGTTVALTQSQCRPLTLSISGTPGGIVTYTVPSGVGGQWIVRNGTSGGYAVRIQSLAGGTYVSIAAGDNVQVSCDGTSTGMVRSTTAAAGAAGSNTQVQYNSGGVLAGSSNFAFDGSTVSMPNLRANNDVILGTTGGNTLTLYGNTVAIPNTLNIGSDTMWMTAATKQVGIGTTTVGSDKLVVAGTIKSTSGGFVFPDSTTQSTAAALPPGIVVPYALAAAPAGWLICAGQSVAKASYPALDAVFNAAGYPYGSDTNNFTLPDLRGRVVAGVDNQGGSAAGRLTNTTMSPDGNTIGAGGGAQTVTLTAAQIPPLASGVGVFYTTDPFGPVSGYLSATPSSPVYNATNSYAGAAHPNVQPTILMYYIIKT